MEDCSKNENFNYASLIKDENENIKYYLNKFLTNYIELNNTIKDIKFESGSELEKMQTFVFGLCVDNDATKSNCSNLAIKAGQKGGLFGSFNCGFLRNDLNIVYLTLYEASI